MQPVVTNNSSNTHASILSPSDAVLTHILSFLPPKSTGHILTTCSELRSRIFQNETVWKNNAAQMKIPRQISHLSWKKTVLLDAFWERGILKVTNVKLQVNTPPNVPQLGEEGPKKVFHFYNSKAIETHDLNAIDGNKNGNDKNTANSSYRVVEQNNQSSTIWFNDGDKVLGVEPFSRGEIVKGIKITVYDKDGKIERSFQIRSYDTQFDAIRIKRNTLFLYYFWKKETNHHQLNMYFTPIPNDQDEVFLSDLTCLRGWCYTESPTDVTIFKMSKIFRYNLDEQRKGPLKLEDLERIPFPFTNQGNGLFPPADISDPLKSLQRIMVHDVIVFLGMDGLFGKDAKAVRQLWKHPNFDIDFDHLIPSNDGSHIFAIAQNNPKDPEKNGYLMIFNALSGRQIGMIKIDDSNKDYRKIMLSYNSVGYVNKNGDFVFKEFSFPPEMVIEKGNRSIEDPASTLIENNEPTSEENKASKPTTFVGESKKIKIITPKNSIFSLVKRIAKWGLAAFTVFALIRTIYLFKADPKFRLIK
ncbi:MAG: hypothetical protein H0W88_07790 [Parachlamydiaceae bacterium]|nr:hypothetical protein [Parachlamydiaceae bacterium]